jgi:hypothetical protein
MPVRSGLLPKPVPPNAYAGAGGIPITASLRTKCQQTADSHRFSAKGDMSAGSFHAKRGVYRTLNFHLRSLFLLHHWRLYIAFCVGPQLRYTLMGQQTADGAHINLGLLLKD